MKPGRVGCAGFLRWREGVDLENTVALLKAQGADWGREGFQWNRVEVRRGYFDWTHLDRMMAACARHHMRLVAIPHSPPKWHQDESLPYPSQTPPIEGQALADYIAFLAACIIRYGTRGTFWVMNPSLPYTPITHWDIWNEPYLPNSWATGPNAVEYGHFFADVVSAVQGLDGVAKFMLEVGPLHSIIRWLDAIAANTTALQHADALSVHPYTRASPLVCTGKAAGELCRVEALRDRIHQLGRKTPIWITEVGWPTSGYYSITEEEQAIYVHELFQKLRKMQVVQGLIYYTHWTYGRDPADREHWFGLVNADYSPKPAWAAFGEEARKGFEYVV